MIRDDQVQCLTITQGKGGPRIARDKYHPAGARGLIERIKGSKPQRLRRAKGRR